MNFVLVVLSLVSLIPMVDSFCWPWEGIDCILSDWSTWSSCDAPCGTNITGKQETKRTKIRVPDKCGKQCEKLFDKRSCTRLCCPVNCVYSWSAWSSCKGCGSKGEQTSSRVISQNESCGGTCVKPSRKRTCDTGT